MASQILSKRNAHVLARFAAADVLVALDYDGTLAPIVSTPRKARMRPRTRQLLAAVAKRYPCVVISGRMRDDVTARVSSIPVWHVAGNHGLEPWGEQEAYAAKVRQWVTQLRRLLACEKAIYVGDDETDEDAFAAGRADRLLSVRIGNARRSRAAYRLKDQRQIDRFLRRLLALRSA